MPLSDLADTTTRGWFDIALPDLKIVIEIDGAHHFKPTTYGGSEDEAQMRFETQKNNDRRKDRLATDAGWIVVRFTDKEARELESVDLWNRINESSISRELEILSAEPHTLQKTILKSPDLKPLSKYMEERAQTLLQKQRDWRKEQYKRFKEWKKNEPSPSE